MGGEESGTPKPRRTRPAAPSPHDHPRRPTPPANPPSAPELPTTPARASSPPPTQPPSPPPSPPPEGEGIELAPGVRVFPNTLTVSASRSGGPGGQNVNKRSTKVELRLRVADLPLKPWQLQRLRHLAGHRLTNADELLIVAESERTQGGNRRQAMERLRALIVEAMHRPPARKATKPSRGSIERRLQDKRASAEKKRRRSDPLD